jgi:hypothetical protein
MTTSWLRNFLDFVERNTGYEDMAAELSVATEAEFIRTLRTAYLTDLSTPLHLDVHFSADGRHIEASRFLLQGYRIYDALDETAMVSELRAICAEVSTPDFKVRSNDADTDQRGYGYVVVFKYSGFTQPWGGGLEYSWQLCCDLFGFYHRWACLLIQQSSFIHHTDYRLCQTNCQLPIFNCHQGPITDYQLGKQTEVCRLPLFQLFPLLLQNRQETDRDADRQAGGQANR